jgi:REP element-mobilizing transposase RayT
MRPEKQRRHPIRLKGYDYSVAAAYFVTICTQDRMALFGDIVNDAMRVNQYGRVVSECWKSIPAHFPRAGLDAFVVMPNHIHGMIQLADATGEVFVGAQHAAPFQSITYRPLSDRHVRPGSLGAMVRSFKSAVVRRINSLRETSGMPVWQRNYYEHVIRDESEVLRIREYILANPARWAEDEENPNAIQLKKVLLE